MVMSTNLSRTLGRLFRLQLVIHNVNILSNANNIPGPFMVIALPFIEKIAILVMNARADIHQFKPSTDVRRSLKCSSRPHIEEHLCGMISDVWWCLISTPFIPERKSFVLA
ncbi:hypothetical protein Ae201684_014429 [Aphanomyces euteiches]|uniref:Uncharacterized protein n=1 Tax=Aphanomyces euteiches TaxID=100861 RepID=A0A6G0WK42_9STRA|nr:hypothetical protein Ae201684_014429 [Aphanomyces euteiches]